MLAPIIGPLLGVIVSDIVFGLALNALAPCGYNIFKNCVNENAGGGGGGSGEACASPANSCGQRNSGFIVGGTCNSSAPPNSQCPVPAFSPDTGFYAEPSTIGTNDSTTLHWNVTDATECSVTGENGLTYTGGATGQVSTGALTQTTTFTITCKDGEGGPTASKSLRVIVDARYQEV